MKKIYDKPEIEILLFDEIEANSGAEGWQSNNIGGQSLTYNSTTYDLDAPDFDVYTVEDVIIK